MGEYLQNIRQGGAAVVAGTVTAGIAAQSYDGGMAAIVDRWHYMVEIGTLFGASSGGIQGAAAGSTFDCIIVPVAADIDIKLKASSDTGFEFFVFDTPTITDSGTETSLVNFNRSIGGVGAVTFYIGAELATTGTTLWNEDIPAADNKGGAAIVDAASEWVLVAGTVYGFRINPKAAGTLNLSLLMY